MFNFNPLDISYLLNKLSLLGKNCIGIYFVTDHFFHLIDLIFPFMLGKTS